MTATQDVRPDPDLRAALDAIVPAALRDEAHAIEEELHNLYPTIMELCERAVAMHGQLNACTASANAALTAVVAEHEAFEAIDDVQCSAWEITSRLSGVMRIIEALYAARDVFGIAAEHDDVEQFRSTLSNEKGAQQ